MNHIQHTAHQFLFDLHRGIFLEDLIQYVKTKLEWQVVYYHTEEPNAFLHYIDQTMLEFAEKTHGFLYKPPHGKYLALNGSLTDAEQLHNLTHEIAHILLGHMDNDILYNSIQQEKEADAFVNYVLYSQTTGMEFNLSSTSFTKNSTDIVYVTPSGTKYHMENCKFANDAIAISISKAKEHYAPCSYCNPDK